MWKRFFLFVVLKSRSFSFKLCYDLSRVLFDWSFGSLLITKDAMRFAFLYSIEMKEFKAVLNGRDEIQLSFGDDNKMQKIQVVGCTDLLSLVRKYQIQFGQDLLTWPLPKGVSHSELLLKEVLLKAQGKWEFPFKDLEICHCRNVQTEVVDQAIVAGAHQSEVVSRQTSASTACGTCRLDVEKIISFRLGKAE